MADDTATVTVPRELLREVLDHAAVNLEAAAMDYQFWMPDGHYDYQRARIAELRRLAGMEE